MTRLKRPLHDFPRMARPTTENTIVIIPARMGSSRLPGKPLAAIAGDPMIVHVWRRACEASIGDAVVAAGEREIIKAVAAAGGRAVKTDAALPSGSDRVLAALAAIDPARRYEYVVNLQGDLPTISPDAIRACLATLAHSRADIATLAAEMTAPEQIHDKNVVKALATFRPGSSFARAEDFVRLLPSGRPPPHYHHIGVYAYQRAALERFVSMPPSRREQAERLEQLRALDAGMHIEIALVDEVPFGVDTADDLERVRRLFSGHTAA